LRRCRSIKVSHDRHFLRSLVTRAFEIDHGQMLSYDGTTATSCTRATTGTAVLSPTHACCPRRLPLQQQGEAAPLADPAGDGDFAEMGLGDVFDDRQPEAGPAEIAAAGAIDPVEALK